MPSGPPTWFSRSACPGNALRQRGQVADLRMIQPRIERQAERRQAGEALAERRRRYISRGGGAYGRVHQRRIGVIGGDVADAAEPAAAGADMRFQHVAGLARRCADRHGRRCRRRSRSGRSRREALIAATPLTNSVSPTGLNASGPVGAVHRRGTARRPWRRCCGRCWCRPAGRPACRASRAAPTDGGADRRSAGRVRGSPRCGARASRRGPADRGCGSVVVLMAAFPLVDPDIVSRLTDHAKAPRVRG